jgi:hypothetical protein
MTYLFPVNTPYRVPENPFRGQITKALKEAHSTALKEALSDVQGPFLFDGVESFNYKGEQIGSDTSPENFDAAVITVVAAIERGYFPARDPTPLGPSEWARLSSALLAAIGRGYHRQYRPDKIMALDEARKRALDPEPIYENFPTFFHRLAATAEDLGPIVGEGMTNYQDEFLEIKKRCNEKATKAAATEVDEKWNEWKANELDRRASADELLIQTHTREKGVSYFIETAKTLGLHLTREEAPKSQTPTPKASRKRTISGTAPESIPTPTATRISLPRAAKRVPSASPSRRGRSIAARDRSSSPPRRGRVPTPSASSLFRRSFEPPAPAAAPQMPPPSNPSATPIEVDSAPAPVQAAGPPSLEALMASIQAALGPAIQAAMAPYTAKLDALEKASMPPPSLLPAAPPATRRARHQITAMPTAPATPIAHQARLGQNAAPAPAIDPEEGFITVARKGRKSKGTANTNGQTRPLPTQINLTPASYAKAAANAASTQQPLAPRKLANPLPSITEVTVLRTGGHFDPQVENYIRSRAADAIVREVRIKMAKAVAKPIALRAGRWSAHARSKGNFVFSFDGCVPFDVIQSYELLLLEPFYGCGQLCPSMGWTRFLAHGVPTWDIDIEEGTIFGPDAILREVRLMPGLKKAAFAMQPRWLKQVGSIETDYSSITFAISDPDGTITNTLLNSRAALFGKEVSVQKWVDKPPLVQCSHCHTLGHNRASKACRLGKDSVKCFVCGGAHKGENHDKHCPRKHRFIGKCDCKYKCLNCQQPGHNCRDVTCPARALYRPRGTRKPANRNKGKEMAAGPSSEEPRNPDREPDDPIGDLYDPIEAPRDPHAPPADGPAHQFPRPPSARRRSPSLTQEDYDRIDIHAQRVWDRDHHYNSGFEIDGDIYLPPDDNSNPATRTAQATDFNSEAYAAPDQYATSTNYIEPLAGWDDVQVIQNKAYSPSHSIGDANQMNLS